MASITTATFSTLLNNFNLFMAKNECFLFMKISPFEKLTYICLVRSLG